MMGSRIEENQCREMLSYLVLGLEKGRVDFSPRENRFLFDLSAKGSSGSVPLTPADSEFLEGMLRKAHEGLRTISDFDPARVDGVFHPFRIQLKEQQPVTLHCPRPEGWEGKNTLPSPLEQSVSDESMDRYLKSLELELPSELRVGGDIQNPRAFVILEADDHTSAEEQKRYLSIVSAVVQATRKNEKIKLIRADEGADITPEETEKVRKQLKDMITQKYYAVKPLLTMVELFDLFYQDADIRQVVQTHIRETFKESNLPFVAGWVAGAKGLVLNFALATIPHEEVFEDPTDPSIVAQGKYWNLVSERSQSMMKKIDAVLKKKVEEDPEATYVVFRHVGAGHLALEMEILDNQAWSYLAIASPEILRVLQRFNQSKTK